MRRVLDLMEAVFTLAFALAAIGITACWVLWPVLFVIWAFL